MTLDNSLDGYRSVRVLGPLQPWEGAVEEEFSCSTLEGCKQALLKL